MPEDNINNAITALGVNGIRALVVDTGDEAKKTVLSLIPPGSEVFTMSSVTLTTIGLPKEINESGNYKPIRPLLMQPELSKSEKVKLGSAPEYAVGSVQAVTVDGKVLMASNTGSQLAAYVYGARHVIWVVGTQKIVKNVDAGITRIYDVVLPLESERAHQAYGVPGSFVSKLLIINKEIVPDRITLIFVREKLGF